MVVKSAVCWVVYLVEHLAVVMAERKVVCLAYLLAAALGES